MTSAGWLRWAPLIAVVVSCAVFSLAGPASSASTCVQCHTDVKKLIRLGWEVEKIRGKPRVSAENEGEG